MHFPHNSWFLNYKNFTFHDLNDYLLYSNIKNKNKDDLKMFVLMILKILTIHNQTLFLSNTNI